MIFFHFKIKILYVKYTLIFMNLKLSSKKNQGFALIELVIVFTLISLFSGFGVPYFRRFLRRSIFNSAKSTMINIKKECESNRDLGLDKTFSISNPKYYLIQSREINNCLGLFNSGLVVAQPQNKEDYPFIYYDFNKNDIKCEYDGKDNFFNCDRSQRYKNLSFSQRKIKYENYNFVHKNTYIERGCSGYLIVDGPKWKNAQANARKIGGNLTTINNAGEWDWFQEEYKPKKYAYGTWADTYNNYPNGEVQLWVGISDHKSEGDLVWVSGEKSNMKINKRTRISNSYETPRSDNKNTINVNSGWASEYEAGKNDYGVWQFERNELHLYDDRPVEELKKEGWGESAWNIRGIAEVNICNK